MTPKERLREIGKVISEAMSKVDVDWSRESPTITERQADLDEMVTQYYEDTASKAEVKAAYKAWVRAHKGGLF